MMAQQAEIRTPVRYAHRDHPPGIFYALSHGASTCAFAEHVTTVHNARAARDPFTLDTTGVALVDHVSRVQDFADALQVETIYVPEMQRLIRSMTGASHVIVFHKLAREEKGEDSGKRQPAGNAHIDYTRESFEIWARQALAPKEADRLLRGRWAAINIWRGLRPVERRPLAFVDGRTITPAMLLPVPIHERPGQPTPFVGLNLHHDPAQRWHYFPDMQPDEALVFTLFDSDPARPQNVAHSAIDDPSSWPDAAPRASFEVRTIAFFD